MTDKEHADELKQRLIEAIKPTLAIMDEAMADGIVMEFGVALSMMGKFEVSNIRAVKPL